MRDGDTLAIDKSGAADAELQIVDGEGVVLNAGTDGAEARDLPGGRYLIHVPAAAVAAGYSLAIDCRSPRGDDKTPSVAGGCASTSTSMSSPLLALGLLVLLRRRRR